MVCSLSKLLVITIRNSLFLSLTTMDICGRTVLGGGCGGKSDIRIAGYDHCPGPCLLDGSSISHAMTATDVSSHRWIFSEARASPSEIYPEQSQFLWPPIGRGNLVLQPFAGSQNWR